MQNIATSKLSIININNKTSTNPLVRFSGFPSTKSGFCALFAFRTHIFGLYEHKIEVFVRFCPLTPPFSGFPSTKSEFLCSSKRGMALESVTAETLTVTVAFLQITEHAYKMQIPHNLIINFQQHAR